MWEVSLVDAKAARLGDGVWSERMRGLGWDGVVRVWVVRVERNEGGWSLMGAGWVARWA